MVNDISKRDNRSFGYDALGMIKHIGHLLRFTNRYSINNKIKLKAVRVTPI